MIRVPRTASGPLLLVGAVTIPVVYVLALTRVPDPVAGDQLGWLALGAVFLGVAAFVWHRLPDHPLTGWFALVGGLFPVIQLCDTLIGVVPPDAQVGVALAAGAYHVIGGVAAIAFAHLFGLFPDGAVERPYERRLLRGLWLLLGGVILTVTASPTVVTPYYLAVDPVANPAFVPALAPFAGVGTLAVGVLQATFIVGPAMLIARYRRSSSARRRAIRWLLLPGVLAAFAMIVDVAALTDTGIVLPKGVLQLLWSLALVSVPVAVAIALLRPDLLDVDVVLRRSLVYGMLWTAIAATYVLIAAGLGLAAGQRLSVGTAIVLTVVATLVFQPARRRLEQLADRWVFGARADPARLVSRLGEALADTVDLDRLLPHMASTLEQGLGLRWARVRLDTDPPTGDPPMLSVEITLGNERLGVVECGPTIHGGGLSEDEQQVVVTFARQAALAVRNVKLTAELADSLQCVREQTAELERSRGRLVRAQQEERRRIERNIHDGIQQDLVALLSHAARVRGHLDDPPAVDGLLTTLQAGLRRVLHEVRELAHGIHPTLLADHGLVAAVESLARRSTVPVDVTADEALATRRLGDDVEGAAYFTVAEALANVLKHSEAQQVAVELRLSGAAADGAVELEVSDDGIGFDPGRVNGGGLSDLAERIAAVGGRLEVDSTSAGTRVRARIPLEPDPTGAVEHG